jgi:hypothetical protein
VVAAASLRWVGGGARGSWLCQPRFERVRGEMQGRRLCGEPPWAWDACVRGAWRPASPPHVPASNCMSRHLEPHALHVPQQGNRTAAVGVVGA